MSQMLADKIEAVRERHKKLSLGTGIGVGVLVFVVLIGVEMLVDFWLDLPWGVRAVWLVANLGLVAAALVKFAMLPIAASPDDDAVALRIEDAYPQFASRLIAAIQLARSPVLVAGASAMLVRATVRQAEAIAKEIDFPPVVRGDRMGKAVMAASAALLLLIAGMVGGRRNHVSGDLLARAMLSNTPVPRKTRIEMPRTDLTIARGDNVDLAAKASGVIPSSGWLDISFASGRRQGFSMERGEGLNTFHRLLENVQDSFEYRVKLGDNTTSWFEVRVLAPPMVTQLHVVQEYPAYTRLPNVERQLGDLSILIGSKLHLDITSNNRIASGVVHWINPQATADVPLVVDSGDARHLTVVAKAQAGSSGFLIRLRDAEGLESRDPVVYRVDLQPDKEPSVRISFPVRKEELVTRVASMEIGFDASDDFGIAALAMKYRIDDGPEGSIPLAIHEGTGALPTRLHNRYDWKVSKLSNSAATKPTLEGSTIEYWLEAVDNNNVTGPGRGSSEHYSARVVSEAEKLAEMAARMEASYQDMQQATDQEAKSHEELGKLLKEQK